MKRSRRSVTALHAGRGQTARDSQANRQYRGTHANIKTVAMPAQERKATWIRGARVTLTPLASTFTMDLSSATLSAYKRRRDTSNLESEKLHCHHYHNYHHHHQTPILKQIRVFTERVLRAFTGGTQLRPLFLYHVRHHHSESSSVIITVSHHPSSPQWRAHVSTMHTNSKNVSRQ